MSICSAFFTAILRLTATVAAGAGLLLSGAAPAEAVALFSNVTLKNGWASAPGATRAAGVGLVSGIVHFRGAVSGGATGAAFTVPVAFRPATNVYMRVDLCNGVAGRVVITPAGDGFIEAPSFADAQCRTSLESATYALTGSGFTALTLQNGWTNGVFGTAPAGAIAIGGVVHFRGAVTNGSSSTITTLPPALRPVTDVYIPVTLCNAAKGRLLIQPSGLVNVLTADGPLAAAQCFTSLEGASFSRTGSGFSPVTLQNGWIGAPFGTDQPGYIDISGVIHLKGAVSSGASGTIFTLPARLRPAWETYAPVDLCNGAAGSLLIAPSGAVSVSASNFLDAQCFTSLEGVSFAINNFVPLSRVNGWLPGPFGTGAPGVGRSGNVVSFTGAVSNGTAALIATIQPVFRPPADVYVPIDLCNGVSGRLLIQPSGNVFVQAGAFSDAQCFTSLEGASYILPPAQPPLTLENGWTPAPFGTNAPRAQLVSGIVRFSGALANGNSSTAFTLPQPMRPSADVYLPITLCNAAKGRLYIAATTGVAQIFSETTFGDAQCFTSLDGVEYRPALGQSMQLALANGWTAGPFATSAVTVLDSLGILRFSGAVRGGSTDTIGVLPTRFRPLNDVYIPVDLCSGRKGRLVIRPNGDVRVFSTVTFADAQCFTSLEGVSFAL